LVSINPAAERIIGLSAEDALGRSGEDIFVQKARLNPGWCREVMIHTEVVLGEGEEQGHYDFRLSPLYDHRGRLTGRLLLMRDITQTVRGEEALHRKVEELTILNAVAVAGSEVGNKLDLIKRTAEVLFRTRFSGKIDLLLFGEPGDNIPDTPPGETPHIVEQDRRRRPSPGLRIPINVGDVMIGMIQAENSKKETLTDSDVRFLTILAGQLATGLEKIRLFDAERRHRQEADTLRQAAAAMTSDLDLKQVLDNILIQLEHVVPNDSSCLVMLQGDTLQTVAARGLGAESESILRDRPMNEDTLFREIRRSGQPVILPATQCDQRLQNWQPGHPVCCWMGVPLMVRSEVIGCLTMYSQQVAAYGQPEADLASAFAGHAAVALENARLFGEVQRLAVTDELMGISNRRRLFELGEREFNRTQRSGRPISVIMLDLDHFKRVNDTLGHAVGDQVLRAVSGRCLKNVRNVDIVGRYGGEEIVIVLPETEISQAGQTAERLRQIIANEPVETNAGPVNITASFGVTVNSPEVTALSVLIDRADANMYLAKNAGRNCVKGYD
ncbi:MAG: diguanylate cyclase, partial [Deltaproteobacteria bacterium]|nr:diguanylate cyclase [Deltaproteobacteria bacterium]